MWDLRAKICVLTFEREREMGKKSGAILIIVLRDGVNPKQGYIAIRRCFFFKFLFKLGPPKFGGGCTCIPIELRLWNP